LIVITLITGGPSAATVRFGIVKCRSSDIRASSSIASEVAHSCIERSEGALRFLFQQGHVDGVMRMSGNP